MSERQDSSSEPSGSPGGLSVLSNSRSQSPLIELLRTHPYWGLFLFAFFFRLIYIAESASNPLFGVPVVDASAYHEWAMRIARGEWLWTTLSNYTPVYPYFLGIQKFLFGPSDIFNRWIQCAMGALSAVLLARVGERIWNRQAGMATGLILATYWLLVVYECEEYAESFSIFFQSVALFCLICRSESRISALFAGIAFALSGAARPNILLLFPFIAAWIIWKHWGSLARSLQRSALFILGAAFVLCPILARNYQLVGYWTLRTQGNWSFYSGIDPKFEGLPIPPGFVYDSHMREPLLAGAKTSADVELYWNNRALTILRDQPFEVLKVVARRGLMLFSRIEFSKEFDVYAYRNYSRLLSLPWPGFWLVGPLGFLGILLVWRWSRDSFLILLYLAVGTLSVVPFKFADRYRLPIAPLLAVFAGFAIWRLASWIRQKRTTPLAIAVTILAGLCALSWPDWLGLNSRRIARHDFFVGEHYAQIGKDDEAIEAFKRSMADYSWDADSPYHAARIHWVHSRFDEAESLLKEALKREPSYPEALNLMGGIALERGDVKGSEQWTSRSLELYPTYEAALLQRAKISRRRGDVEREIADYRAALENGRNPTLAMEFALRLDSMGRAQEALDVAEPVVADAGADRFLRARAFMFSADVWVRRLDNVSRATEIWKTVVREFGDVPFMQFQAQYLTEQMDQPSFIVAMRKLDSPVAEKFSKYTLALALWISGKRDDARREFTACLDHPFNPAVRPATLPEAWAWDFLQKR